MEAAIKNYLIRRSTVYRDVGPEVLSILSDMAQASETDPKVLALKFDRFMTVSRGDSQAATMQDVEAFRRQQNSTQTAASLYAKNSWDDLGREALADKAGNYQRLSPYLAKSISPSSGLDQERLPSLGFKANCSKGIVHSVYNAGLEENVDQVEEAGDAPSVEIIGETISASDLRYMTNSLVQRVTYIENRICLFERLLEEKGPPVALQSLAVAVQEPSYFVGRICCDTEEGRLNPKSIMLEGSVRTSNGARVRLDLSACPEYRLFPGQVLIVKGTNPSGFCVVASNILNGMPLSPSKQPKEHHVGNLSMLVAAGPFTAADNFAYEPLEEFLNHAAEIKVGVVLLIGPFLAEDHPLVLSGTVDETYENIVEIGFYGQLASFAQRTNGKIKILLIPSPKDVHLDPVFPQSPFLAPPYCISLSNPATFSCNGVEMGCCSLDWLISCSKEEIALSKEHVDRLTAIASHTLYQRNYFPMFPPPTGTSLDSALGSYLDLPINPHILITPSDLMPFAKSVRVQDVSIEEDGVSKHHDFLCINPGRLSKGCNPGTFVKAYIAPNQLVNDDFRIEAGCRVEILKL